MVVIYANTNIHINECISSESMPSGSGQDRYQSLLPVTLGARNILITQKYPSKSHYDRIHFSLRTALKGHG